MFDRIETEINEIFCIMFKKHHVHYLTIFLFYFAAQSFPVDIWALGVFIFEMLDGKAPFRDRSRVALADLILAGIEPMLKVIQTCFDRN